METLLKPGDMIRIRSDIREGRTYNMLNSESGNDWLRNYMLPAGTLVKIVDISDQQYIVNAIDLNREKDYDDEFWLYTDEMFDPELISLLLE